MGQNRAIEPGILAPRTFPDLYINMLQPEPRTLQLNDFQ